MLGSAELHIGFEYNGIVRNKEWIKKFVNRDGLLVDEPIVKIFAFEHASDAIFGGQPNDVVARELVEPLAVVTNFRFCGIENLEYLFEIGFGVGLNLFAGKRRTRFALAGGIAHHRRKIANQKHSEMSHILEMF